MFLNRLAQRVAAPQAVPTDYESLRQDPLASWIESNLGLTTDAVSGRLIRARPRSISGQDGAARQLSAETGLPESRCAEALTRLLMAGYGIPNPETGLPTFAFRLHQFISRGDTVYASLEAENKRYLTVYGQQFVPGDRGRILLPLAFCRECGQEYYVVRRVKDQQTGLYTFIPRDLSDRPDEESGDPGFLYSSSDNPWPATDQEIIERLPEDWLEEFHGGLRVRSNQRKHVPQSLSVAPDGRSRPGQPGWRGLRSLRMQFVPAPFRLCLHCGVTYGARQQSDFSKLTELSSGGRSTDTTMLSLSLLRTLRSDADLKKEARKLLSFTDNRQDASLQAGHFNDFIEIALLRAALYRAVEKAGAEGIRHDVLAQRVFEAFQLDFALFAANPEARFGQKDNTLRALREVLGYRIYRDLKRGWRLTSPNLEQCGLLEIDYISLDEVCAADDLWEQTHPALASASPETRLQVCKVLLDYMRRELAIKVDYLDPVYQDSLKQQSSQYLKTPWAMDENGTLEPRRCPLPTRARRERAKQRERVSIGARRLWPVPAPQHHLPGVLRDKITVPETAVIIQQLLNALVVGDLVKIVDETKERAKG